MPTSEADHGAGEAKEGVVDVGAFLVARSQTAPTEEPGEWPLNDATIDAQAAAVFDAALRDRRKDAARPQRPTDRSGIVRAVGEEDVGTTARSAARPLNGRNRFDEFEALLRIVDVGAGVNDRQRQTRGVGQQVTLGTRLATVGGIGSGLRPPKTARTEQLSTATCDQSMSSSTPNRSRTFSHNCCQTPASCHSWSRRQQVMPQPQPISMGSSSHGVPVFKTKRMPTKQLRSGTRGRPPFGDGLCLGSSGSTSAHNSSGTNGFATTESSLTAASAKREIENQSRGSVRGP